jgi:hypothetical protein
MSTKTFGDILFYAFAICPSVRLSILPNRDRGSSNCNQYKREQQNLFYINRIRGHGPLLNKRKKTTIEMALYLFGHTSIHLHLACPSFTGETTGWISTKLYRSDQFQGSTNFLGATRPAGRATA